RIPIVNIGTNIELTNDNPFKLNKNTINEQTIIISIPKLKDNPNCSLNIAPLPETIILNPVYSEILVIISINADILSLNILPIKASKLSISLLYIFKSNNIPTIENKIPEIYIPQIPLVP